MITQTTEEVSYIDPNGNIAYRIVEIFQGDEAANNIVGTDTTDVLYGWGGDDTLNGGYSADTLIGGAGNDRIIGEDGDDLIVQSADSFTDNDSLTGSAGFDTLDYSNIAGAGMRIEVDFGTGTVRKYQDERLVGTDKIVDIEKVIGTRYADKMTGGKTDCILDGSDGDDMIDGGTGNDMVLGGTGRDYLSGEAGDDTINGGAGNDVIRDRGGNDVFAFDRGFGQDELMSINPEDSAHFDVVQFNGISANEIFFKREDNYNLGVSVAGTTDSLSIDFWYGAPGDVNGSSADIYKADQFRVGYQTLSARYVDYYVTVVGASPVSMATLIGLEAASHNSIQ